MFVPSTYPKKGENSVTTQNLIQIDRSEPFDPTFFGKNYLVVESDQRSLALTEIDLNKVMNVASCEDLTYDRNLWRLKRKGFIRLDAKILQVFLEDPSLIPEDWKSERIRFDGNVFYDQETGSYFTLEMYWCEGKWSWRDAELLCGWIAQGVSACLAA